MVCEVVRYSGWSIGVMRENAPTFTAEEVIGNSKHRPFVAFKLQVEKTLANCTIYFAGGIAPMHMLYIYY